MEYQWIPNHPGTYALVLCCDKPFQVQVGRLGQFVFEEGYWIYTGSAFGPGGLRARLAHHLKPSPRPHWHIDYIKLAMRPVEAWITIDKVSREHAWAACMAGRRPASRPIPGFGASDCSCRSHLIHWRRRPTFDGFRRQLLTTIPAQAPLHRVPCSDLHSSEA